MESADMHMHALFASDDGAKTQEQMLAMVDAAYADGSRLICLTPHFHPGYFGDNRRASEEAYEILSAYAKEKYPDLVLVLGNELRYSKTCTQWLAQGQCRLLGPTHYLLVDFYETERADAIEEGLNRLLSAGYKPILAHAERYTELWGKRKRIRQLRSRGVKIQLDAGSVLGDFGFRTKMAAKGLLAEHLVDFIGSDAHDLEGRPPGIRKAYQYISKKYGEVYAHNVCCANVRRLFGIEERNECHE